MVEAEQAIETAARESGPFYIRTCRPKIPVIYDESHRFRLGKAHVMRPGKDVTVMAIGELVASALEAAELLAKEGIDCRVLNMASLKPVDVEAIRSAARETGGIVTAEDHLVHGGLGSLVAQTVALDRPVPMAFVGMQDEYATSGRWDELLEHYGLTPAEIADAARGVIGRKDG